MSDMTFKIITGTIFFSMMFAYLCFLGFFAIKEFQEGLKHYRKKKKKMAA